MANAKKANQPSGISTVVKVAMGLGLLSVGTWLIWIWRWDVATLLRGSAGILIILIGTMCLAIAKE